VTLSTLGLGVFTREWPACLHVIKGADVHLHDLVTPTLVLFMAEVAVYVPWDPTVVAFSALDPTVDLLVTAPALRGLGDVDVIPVALTTLI